MRDPALDRRKHGFFRILHMDFSSFWRRIILRRKDAPESHPRPKEVAATAPSPFGSRGEAGFTTGVVKLDEQHHEIREGILALQKDLRAGQPDATLLQAMDRLLQKMSDHFRYEESYLEHIKFPDLVHHKGEHDRFRADAAVLRERLAAGDPGVALDLSSFLFNWFRRHTLEEDATFAQAARRR